MDMLQNIKLGLYLTSNETVFLSVYAGLKLVRLFYPPRISYKPVLFWSPLAGMAKPFPHLNVSPNILNLKTN